MEKKIIIRIQADTKIGQIWISTNGGEPEYTWLKIRQDKDGTKVWNARNGIYAKLPQKRYRFNWTKHITALQTDLETIGWLNEVAKNRAQNYALHKCGGIENTFAVFDYGKEIKNTDTGIRVCQNRQNTKVWLKNGTEIKMPKALYAFAGQGEKAFFNDLIAIGAL